MDFPDGCTPRVRFVPENRQSGEKNLSRVGAGFETPTYFVNRSPCQKSRRQALCLMEKALQNRWKKIRGVGKRFAYMGEILKKNHQKMGE